MSAAAPTSVPARRAERGFALLIVFLLAAAVALMLYQQIPRVAFESQRDKEEMLIEHGQQYTRAIQLYYVAFKKYPAKIEDLENTNNKRFLRRRFIDPMTGKDEWRLIHVNAAGMLTDSLVQKPPTAGQPGTTVAGANGTAGATGPGGLSSGTNAGTSGGTNGGTNGPANSGTGTNGFTGTSNVSNVSGTGLGTGSGTNGGNTPNQPPEVNATVFRRPSDRPLVGPNGMASSNDVDPNDPRYWPPISLVQPPGPSGAPPPGAQSNGAQTGPQGVPQGFQQQGFQPGAQPGVQIPGLPGGFQPNAPGLPGGPTAGANTPGFVQQFPGQQYPGQQYPGQPNPALQNSGAPSSQINPNGQPGATPQYPTETNPSYPNPPPNIPGFPPQVFAGQFNPQQPVQTGQAGQPGAAGSTANGMPSPGGPGNSALAAINTLLTTPRQSPAPIPDAGGSMNMGGLVGVASTYAAPSIKVYKDRHKYNEWEFIFDLKSGIPGQASAAAPAGQNGQGQGMPGQGTPGQSGPGQNTGGQNSGQSNSTFGQSNTFAPSTAFGSPSGSAPPPPPPPQ